MTGSTVPKLGWKIRTESQQFKFRATAALSEERKGL